MKNDQLKQFIALRASLLEEKAGLLSRLAQIEEALGPGAAAAAPVKRAARRSARAAKATPPAKVARKVPRRRKARRKLDQPPLPELIRQLTAPKPLAKAEIVEALQKANRPFSASYLHAILYSKVMKRVNGKFAPA